MERNLDCLSCNSAVCWLPACVRSLLQPSLMLHNAFRSISISILLFQRQTQTAVYMRVLWVCRLSRCCCLMSGRTLTSKTFNQMKEIPLVSRPLQGAVCEDLFEFQITPCPQKQPLLSFPSLISEGLRLKRREREERWEKGILAFMTWKEANILLQMALLVSCNSDLIIASVLRQRKFWRRDIIRISSILSSWKELMFNCTSD